MKAVLFLLMSFSVFGMDLDQMMLGHCQNSTLPARRAGYFIKNEPSFHFDGREIIAAQRKSNILKLESLDLQTGTVGQKILERPNNVTAIERSQDGSVWILSGMNLYQLSSDLTVLIDTFVIPSLDNKAITRGLGYHTLRDQLLIAKSHEGILIFDVPSKTFVNRIDVSDFSPRPELSMVVDVVAEADKAFVLMTSYAEGGFNGVVTIDLNSNAALSANEYDPRRAGVIDVVGRIYSHQKKIYINNGGWIHQFDHEVLMNNKMVRPKWISIRKKVDGRDLFMMINGDFVFDQGMIKGCASYPQLNPSTNRMEYVNDLVSSKL